MERQGSLYDSAVIAKVDPVTLTQRCAAFSWSVANARFVQRGCDGAQARFPGRTKRIVLSTSGPSWTTDVALETRPTRSPPPNSSLPTAFTVLTGSSNEVTLNAPSSAGAKVNFVALARSGSHY
ncbi:hypothetical protein [Bradyrhizobium sp. Ash2021]|uniref:hypothetical protein n=1 Tax=Bradyrhizobium sp. Ash2021 TaxID=2954771 RepID=UPI0028167914|nr:hypothetical protein [Bradyrhizobium sp. Ash2021]WMT79388.1 hypothetical protein NL528_45770 [Bradyrhizobium sp. Ash2021]